MRKQRSQTGLFNNSTVNALSQVVTVWLSGGGSGDGGGVGAWRLGKCSAACLASVLQKPVGPTKLGSEASPDIVTCPLYYWGRGLDHRTGHHKVTWPRHLWVIYSLMCSGVLWHMCPGWADWGRECKGQRKLTILASAPGQKLHLPRGYQLPELHPLMGSLDSKLKSLVYVSSVSSGPSGSSLSVSSLEVREGHWVWGAKQCLAHCTFWWTMASRVSRGLRAETSRVES